MADVTSEMNEDVIEPIVNTGSESSIIGKKMTRNETSMKEKRMKESENMTTKIFEFGESVYKVLKLLGIPIWIKDRNFF